MLGPGGFSSARDIAAITVNRWPHGYGYVGEFALRRADDYDEDAQARAPAVRPRRHRQFGRRAATPTRTLAIDQAARAVREVLD